MSTFDALLACQGPLYGNFDLARGSVDWVAEMLAKADIPVVLQTGTEEDDLVANLFSGEIVPQVFDAKGEMKAELDRAIELIEEARQTTMKILAELP